MAKFVSNITFTGAQTVDGVDISAYLNQAVLTSSSPSFVGLGITSAAGITMSSKFTITYNSGDNCLDFTYIG